MSHLSTLFGVSQMLRINVLASNTIKIKNLNCYQRIIRIKNIEFIDSHIILAAKMSSK